MPDAFQKSLMKSFVSWLPDGLINTTTKLRSTTSFCPSNTIYVCSNGRWWRDYLSWQIGGLMLLINCYVLVHSAWCPSRRSPAAAQTTTPITLVIQHIRWSLHRMPLNATRCLSRVACATFKWPTTLIGPTWSQPTWWITTAAAI